MVYALCALYWTKQHFCTYFDIWDFISVLRGEILRHITSTDIIPIGNYFFFHIFSKPLSLIIISFLINLSFERLFKSLYSFINQSIPTYRTGVKSRFMSGKFALNKRSPSDNGILPFSESSGRGQDSEPRRRTGWVICYGMAVPLFSSLCNQISNWFLPFIFFFLLFLAREKITSVFLFLGGLKKKKTPPFYCPKLHTEFQRVTSSQI